MRRRDAPPSDLCAANLRLMERYVGWRRCVNCKDHVKREPLWTWVRAALYIGQPEGRFYCCQTCAPAWEEAVQRATRRGTLTLVKTYWFKRTEVVK